LNFFKGLDSNDQVIPNIEKRKLHGNDVKNLIERIQNVTSSARLFVEYLGCRHLGICFKYRSLAQVFQSRINEKE